MKKRAFIILLFMLLLQGCFFEKKWHINSLELADEYYPKYFQAIENSLDTNGIQYSKKLTEWISHAGDEKCYLVSYYVSKDIYYAFKFEATSDFGTIECNFFYNNLTKNDLLNISDNYLNVLDDTITFCCDKTNYGKNYKQLFEELKETYFSSNNDSTQTQKEFTVSQPLKNGDNYYRKKIELSMENDSGNLKFCLYDSLLDKNIYNENK